MSEFVSDYWGPDEHSSREFEKLDIRELLGFGGEIHLRIAGAETTLCSFDLTQPFADMIADAAGDWHEPSSARCAACADQWRRRN